MKGSWSAAGAVLFISAAGMAIACGGAGPKQADAPKVNLEEPPADSATPSASSGDLGAANAALEAKDYATARTKAEAVLAKSPKDGEALFIVGVCDEADKKPDDAVTHYKGALAADPKNSGAAVNLSALLIELKRFDEAIDVAKAALESAKGTAELHINLAYALQGKGDHAGASKAFANAATLRPEDPDVRIWQGQELLDSGDKDGAQKAFKAAISKAGTHADVAALAAIGLFKCGDAPGCVATLDKVIAANPGAELLIERAICKHGAKDLAGARADLDASIAKTPSIKAHVAAGRYADEAGDKNACRQHFGEAAKMAQGMTKVAEEIKKGLQKCK